MMSIFIPGNEHDFSSITFCPVKTSYLFKIDLCLAMNVLLLSQKTKISSAYDRWEINGGPLGPLKAKALLDLCRFSILLPNASAHIMNKLGDIGSPCLKHLVKSKYPQAVPLTRIEN